jgi:recombination protein RecT
MSKQQQEAPLVVIGREIYGIEQEFNEVLADPSINFKREAEFAIQVLEKNSYSLTTAMNNRSSVIAAVKNIAAIGISLNPAKKQAYLVPRGGAICLDISYMGLLDLAIASGSIRWGQAELVREKDTFRLNGFDKPPTHEYDPFATDRGDLRGAYVVVKTVDGDYLTTAMPIGEIFDIRDRSESWKAFVSKKAKSTPWASDEGEMVKKTVIKRASKLWPKTDRLEHAIHYLNTDGGEGLVDVNEKPEPAAPVKHKIGAKGFAAALEAIKAGTYTAEEIKAHHELTDEQQRALGELAVVGEA